LRDIGKPRLSAGENRVRYAGRIDRPYDGKRRLRQARAPVISIACRDVVAEQNGLGAELSLQLVERFPAFVTFYGVHAVSRFFAICTRAVDPEKRCFRPKIPLEAILYVRYKNC